MEPGSLRERKKSKTRELLVAAALELFEQRGFDAVTIDEIAARGGTSPRTFFRYFGSKEAVLFADADEMLAAMHTAITTRPVEEAPLIALRESLIVVSDHYAQHREQHVRRARLAETGAAIADYQRAVLVPQWEEMLAEAVATRLSVQVDVDVRPRLLAGVAIAVMSSVGAAWMASNGASDLEEMYRQAYATLNEAVVQSIGLG